MTVEFTAEWATLLLDSPWLAAVDENTNTPYLLKFYASIEDLKCCILATDTINVWVEALEARHIAHRVRVLNVKHRRQDSLGPHYDPQTEAAWQRHHLAKVSTLHSLKGFGSVSLAASSSYNADLEIQVWNEEQSWCWHAMSAGPASSKRLSTHLIVPLLILSDLAVSETQTLPTTATSKLTKSVDIKARTAKRQPARHVKSVIGKPLVATTMNRITQIVNESYTTSALSKTNDELPVPPSIPALPSRLSAKQSNSPPLSHSLSETGCISPNRLGRTELEGGPSDTEDEDDAMIVESRRGKAPPDASQHLDATGDLRENLVQGAEDYAEDRPSTSLPDSRRAALRVAPPKKRKF